MISTPRKRRNGKRIALVTVLIAFLLIELALLGIVLGTIVYQKYILPARWNLPPLHLWNEEFSIWTLRKLQKSSIQAM